MPLMSTFAGIELQLLLKAKKHCSDMGDVELCAFHPDIQRLISLIISTHSANRESFLRELVSNAVEALYQLWCEPVRPEQLDLYVKITADRSRSTITIEDSGIGMTKSALFQRLGSSPQRGTNSFLEAMSRPFGMDCIDAYGFFSVFLVAKTVQVVSRHSDDEQYIWESNNPAFFTLQKDTSMLQGVVPRGTKVVCYLKEDQSVFLAWTRLKDLVDEYIARENIPLPIENLVRFEFEVVGA